MCVSESVNSSAIAVPLSMSQALHEEGGVLKVHRYRPGEVPQYAKHLEEELKPNAKEHRLSLPRPRTREREHREPSSARADREESVPRESTQTEDVERRRRAAVESGESEDEGTTRVVARAAQRRRPIEPTVIVHAKTDVKEQAKKAPRVVLPQPQAESTVCAASAPRLSGAPPPGYTSPCGFFHGLATWYRSVGKSCGSSNIMDRKLKCKGSIARPARSSATGLAKR